MVRTWFLVAAVPVLVLTLVGCNAPGACSVSQAFVCVEYVGSGFASPDVRAACNTLSGSVPDAGTGTYSAACPQENLLGTCTLHGGTAQEVVEYDYAGGLRTSADFAAACAGVWHAGK
jgi:predicted small secreted protein